MALQLHERENRGYVGEVLPPLRNNWGLHPDGSIESSRFNEMRAKVVPMRDAFIEGADDEEEKMLTEKLWPYQDTIR